MDLFYYGIWLMGVVGAVSMLAIHRSNKRILKDMERLSNPKDKWLRKFLDEHRMILDGQALIPNPAIYVTKRMRGRKIGPITLYRAKGVFWYTFVLSLLCMGIRLYQIVKTGQKTMVLPFVEMELPAMHLTVGTGIGMCILLLLMKLSFGGGYQEELIETYLLDYVENGGASRNVAVVEAAKVMEMKKPVGIKKTAGRKKMTEIKKPAAEKRKAELTLLKKREQAAQELEKGIREAAASDHRYSHLLNKEEEEIVKDVIKEFLT